MPWKGRFPQSLHAGQCYRKTCADSQTRIQDWPWNWSWNALLKFFLGNWNGKNQAKIVLTSFIIMGTKYYLAFVIYKCKRANRQLWQDSNPYEQCRNSQLAFTALFTVLRESLANGNRRSTCLIWIKSMDACTLLKALSCIACARNEAGHCGRIPVVWQGVS